MRNIKTQKSFHQNYRKRGAGQPDYTLAISIGVLILFGLLALSSASSVYSYQKFDGSAYHVVFNQILRGLIPGLILFYFLYKIDYHVWQKFTFPLFLATVILLVSVFIPGIGRDFGRAQSWVSIFGILFQPSEFAKLTFILYLAGWLEQRGYARVRDFKRGIIPFAFILIVILGLIAKQPDIGTMMIFVFTSVAMVYVAGARMSHMGILGIGAAGALSIIMLTSSYIRNRILAFINPSIDPQNIGYHISQSYLAVGSGGFFGKGFGKSVQKFSYLPEVSSDSIFAVIAEELGFFVSFLLVGLFLFIMYRGLKIATSSPDPYGRLIATGIISWLIFQAFLNIMVMIGLAPLTGIPFPFISAGGTALAISIGACGILLNISKQV